MPSRLLPALLILLAGCAAVRRPALPGPAVPREGYVTSGAVRIFYRMVGTGPDTVLVVHHGPGLHHEALAPDLRPRRRSAPTRAPWSGPGWRTGTGSGSPSRAG